MAVFTCPACDHLQDVDDRHVGRPASCPLCGSQGVVTNGVGTRTKPLPADAGEPHVYRKLGPKLGAAKSDLRNTRSAMRKEWFFIDDPRLPIAFVGKAFRGIDVIVDPSDPLMSFQYLSNCTLVVRNIAVAALQLRHFTFDIWGDRMATLQGGETVDLAVGDTMEIRHRWMVASSADVDDLYASLTFVSRVRTQDGLVLSADTAYVLREAQRFSETLIEADFTPSSPRAK
jgi:hypothetical protein